MQLADQYPGDPGVLVCPGVATDEPGRPRTGKALCRPAGNLHAYLSVTGVEIVANSDNVLRGGLTTKYVDIPEQNRVLDFDPVDVDVLDGTPDAYGVPLYPVPTAQFSQSRLDLSGHPLQLSHDGPRVLPVVRGMVVARDRTGAAVIVPHRGPADPSRTPELSVIGREQAFRATDRRLPARAQRTLDQERRASPRPTTVPCCQQIQRRRPESNHFQGVCAEAVAGCRCRRVDRWQGTRLRPLTLSAPKPMLPTAGRAVSGAPALAGRGCRDHPCGSRDFLPGGDFQRLLRQRGRLRVGHRLRRRVGAVGRRRRDPQCARPPAGRHGNGVQRGCAVRRRPALDRRDTSGQPGRRDSAPGQGGRPAGLRVRADISGRQRLSAVDSG